MNSKRSILLGRLKPVQLIFILVFVILGLYRLLTMLPIWPEMILEIPTKKWIKVFSALIFSLGVLFIYLKYKRK